MNEVQDQIKKNYRETERLRKQRIELFSKLAAKRLKDDYYFKDKNGRRKKLGSLFGKQKYLFMIHNMGKKCSYCTMWADGLNDTFKYLKKKGAFVVVSPDDFETQKKFADSRGWKFNMLSPDNNSFLKDVGFEYNVNGSTYHLPGVSVFEKTRGGNIRRVAMDYFGPTDNYCNVWHFYDLLPTENITFNS